MFLSIKIYSIKYIKVFFSLNMLLDSDVYHKELTPLLSQIY